MVHILFQINFSTYHKSFFYLFKKRTLAKIQRVQRQRLQKLGVSKSVCQQNHQKHLDFTENFI